MDEVQDIPQGSRRAGGLVLLRLTCSCLPHRSTGCVWWPQMEPSPWMVTSLLYGRSAASLLNMVPWSLWMNAMPLAFSGPPDGGDI